jgi:hypothetical protein
VDENDPATCEFAIAVADDWQACGIGRTLLDRLERQAATSGIRCMAADTLFANKAMLRLAARSGYAVRTSREDARLVRLEKRLSPSIAPLTFETLAPAQPRAIERKPGHFQYANLARYDALSIALGRQ